MSQIFKGEGSSFTSRGKKLTEFLLEIGPFGIWGGSGDLDQQFCHSRGTGFYSILLDTKEAADKALSFNPHLQGFNINIFPWSAAMGNRNGKVWAPRIIALP